MSHPPLATMLTRYLTWFTAAFAVLEFLTLALESVTGVPVQARATAFVIPMLAAVPLARHYTVLTGGVPAPRYLSQLAFWLMAMVMALSVVVLVLHLAMNHRLDMLGNVLGSAEGLGYAVPVFISAGVLQWVAIRVGLSIGVRGQSRRLTLA